MEDLEPLPKKKEGRVKGEVYSHFLKGKTTKVIWNGQRTYCACVEVGCKKKAQAGTDKCVGCGGGNRCTVLGCTNSAVHGYDKCVSCGGGKR